MEDSDYLGVSENRAGDPNIVLTPNSRILIIRTLKIKVPLMFEKTLGDRRQTPSLEIAVASGHVHAVCSHSPSRKLEVVEEVVVVVVVVEWLLQQQEYE